MIKGIRLSSYFHRIKESFAYVHRNTRILWVRWRRTLDSIPIMVWWVEQQRSEVRGHFALINTPKISRAVFTETEPESGIIMEQHIMWDACGAVSSIQFIPTSTSVYQLDSKP